MKLNLEDLQAQEEEVSPRKRRQARNKEQASKLISEALSGAATASGTGTPEQELEAQGAGFSPEGLSGSSLSPLAQLKPTDLQGPQASGVDPNLFGTFQQRDTPNTNGNAQDIDRFMHAISSQESSHNPNAVNKGSGAHGQFQIMPNNWAPWAKEAGLPSNAPKTQENQNIVARHKMQEYYNQFGSWDAVAVAWFAGPGRAKKFLEGDTSVLNLSDGNMTVGEYINKMNNGMGSAPPGTGQQSAGGQTTGGVW